MNTAAPSPFSLSEIWWKGIILALSIAVLLFSVWCLTHGITTIFMHLYYFPIVLLAYRYRWKGFGLATLLSLAYLSLVIVFDPGEADIILGALYRVFVFVGIAAVIAYLSDLLEKAKSTQQQSAELQDRYLSLAPAIVLALDRNGAITYLNRNGGKILECLPEEVTGKSWADRFLPEKERERVNHVFLQILAGQIEPYRVFENPVVSCGGTKKIIRWHNTVLHDEKGAISGILGFGEDITEEKWRQDTLRDMQQFQESVITNANVWISVLEPDGTLLVWNDAAEAISGYKKTAVLGKRTVWKQLYPDNEYRKKVTVDIQRIIGRDTFLENFETEIRCADGTKKIIVWNTRGQRDTKGAITSYIAIGRDVTAQKSAELRAGESSRFLATMIDTLPIPVFFKDMNGKYLGCNTPFEEYIGIKRDQLAGKTAYDIAPKELADRYTVADRQILDNPHSQRYETQVQYADGSRHDVIFYKAPFFNNDGSVGGLIGAYLDISDRKKAEGALLLEKQRMESLISLSQKSQMADTEIISYVVEDAIRLTGSTIGYLATMNDDESVMTMQYWSKSAHESCSVIDKPIVYRVENTGLWGEAVRQRKPIITNDYAAKSTLKRGTPKGHVPLLRHMNIPVFEGDRIVAIAGVGNKGADYNEGDVSQLQLLLQGWWQIAVRKRAEEEIRLANVILKTQQETSPDGILIVEKTGKILSFNRRFTEIWGIPQDVIDSRSDERALSFVMDKLADPEEFLSRVRYLYEHPQEKSQEEILLKDGKVFERYSAPMIGEDNRYFGRVWYFHDITDRKRAENALRESEGKYRLLTENTLDIIYSLDLAGKITHVSPHIARYGFTPEQFLFKDASTLIYEEDLGKVMADIQINLSSERSTHTIFRFKDAEGKLVWFEDNSAALKDATGAVVGISGVLRDITERKKYDEALRESRQLFVDIISFLPDPTFVIDNEGKVLAWNRALEQLSGVFAGDIIGKGDHEYSLWQYEKRRPILIDLVLHPDQDYARVNYTAIQWDGQTVTGQNTIELQNGRKTVLSLVASPLLDVQGNIVGAIESMRDITRIKETEAELARMNQNLENIVQSRTRALEDEVAQRIRAEKDVQAALDYTRSVIEANPDLMVILDSKGVILDINAAGELLTGIQKEKLIGSPYFGYLVDDGTNFNKFSNLLVEGKLENFVEVRRIDGHITPMSVHAMAVRSKEGGFDRFIVAAHDITRQKKDEKAIQESLDEKIILLREVHHRVKNNLQIIISLVNLQMRQTDDPMVKQIMSETQNRVRAMSLVHEKLYRSESLSRIDFADYTRYLATQLSSFYGSDTRRVRLDFTMDKIMVDINTAVPLGLLINEIVSNALKHAFPNGREGTISISGGYKGDLITLVVKDNGIGIPADFDWKNTTSLGMRLVTSLIDQIDGTITLDRNQGTAFTITVRRKPASEGA